MEQDILTFEKGMFPQLGQLDLPKGAYLDALNMYREEDGALSKEAGSSSIGISGWSKIVGQFLFNDILYYAGINDSGHSGILAIDGNDTVVSYITSGDLDATFNSNSRVRMEGKLNYRSDVILYLAGSNVILTKVNITQETVSELFTDYTLPLISEITESTGGNVPTGNYQFFVRYKTLSDNTTNVSVPSFWYPVIPTTITPSTLMSEVEGASPQSTTDKRLTLSITDIDTTFDTYEVLVATYEGEENTLRAYSLGEAAIVGDSDEFVFTGEGDYDYEVLTSELNVTSVSYESAETIAQKDGTLILGNLKAASQDFDWQVEFANKIKIQPQISSLVNGKYRTSANRVNGVTTEPFYIVSNYESDAATGPNTEFNAEELDTNLLSGYAIPSNNKYKGYRFDEVYSFAVAPVFKDGTEGDAFHVPGLPLMANGTTFQTPGADTYVQCDVATYGEEFGSSLHTLPVSYHKMGGLVNDPANNVSISVDTSEAGEEWKNYAVGFKIVREDRAGKETVLSDTLASSLLRNAADNSDRILPYGMGEVMSGWKIGTGVAIEQDDLYITHDDLVSNIPAVPNTDCYDKRALSLFCPDFQQGILDTDDVLKIQETGIFNTPMLCANTNLGGVRRAIRGMYGYYTMHSTAKGTAATISDRVSLAAQGSFNDQRTDSNDIKDLQEIISIFGTKNLITSGRPKTLVVETDADVDADVTENDIRSYGLFYFNPSDNASAVAGFGVTAASVMLPEYNETRFKRFALLRELPDYYGTIYNKEYQFTAYIKSEDAGVTEVFGGDVYTSMYSMTVPFYGKLNVQETTGTYNEPWGSTTLLVPVQSYNNYYFRHVKTYSAEDPTSGVSSYPLTSKIETNLFGSDQSVGEIGLNNIAVGLGQNKQFNTSYSANNVLKTSYTFDAGVDVITELATRAIYSLTQTTSSVLDSFGIFLSENYHDIPKESGEITALNIVGNELYISTKRKLWRAFYNALVTQSTSEGDIILGNGGAFNRPSVPVVDVGGGYIGTDTQESTVVSPSGMYLYDSNRHKMFYTGTNGLQEITNPGMFNLLKETNLTDVRLGYDYNLKRVMLSSPEITLSYQPELNSFTSKHSYKFSYLTSLGDKAYMVKSATALVDKFNTNTTQIHFGESNLAKFVTSSIVHPSLSKRFVGIGAVTVAKSLSTGKGLPLQFFDKFRAYSNERHTGDNNLIVVDGYNVSLEELGTIFVHRANNKFRMSIPSDIVYDIAEDIHDLTNWVTYPTYSQDNKMFRPDMTDNHIVIEFEVDADKSESSLSLSSLIINFVKNNT